MSRIVKVTVEVSPEGQDSNSDFIAGATYHFVKSSNIDGWDEVVSDILGKIHLKEAFPSPAEEILP